MRGFSSSGFGGSLLGRLVYICERRKGKKRFLRLSRAEKRMRVKEERLQPTLSRYAFGHSGCLDSYLISPFWSFRSIQCLVVWCGRKEPQVVLLGLVIHYSTLIRF